MIDGYFVDNLLIFGGLGDRGYSSKGYQISALSIENASTATLNRLEDELRILLRSIPGNTRLQVRWTVDSDYRESLLGYYRHTESSARNEATRNARNRRFVTYWDAMESHRLRRERIHLYFSSAIEARPRDASTYGAKLHGLLAACKSAHAEIENTMAPIVSHLGGTMKPLTDHGHYCEFLRFFNPSLIAQSGAFDESNFDPLQSILSNCMQSDLTPVTHPTGLYMDGLYHGMLVLQSLPMTTYSGMMRLVTGLDFLGYEVTANIAKLDPAREIEKAESEAKKLERALASNPQTRMRAALELRLARIRRLVSNEIIPFSLQLTIRAWAASPEELSSKLSALRSAISRMEGARSCEIAFPTTVRNFFQTTFPGWCWDRYTDHTLYIEDPHLANLLPLSGSTAGDIDDAEAIYEGSNGNLIGIRTFSNISGNCWPKHALFTGKTGSGKSLLLADLLAQTDPYFEFTAIIDNGRSHLDYFNSVSGGQSLVIRPNGGVTFNYLDTHGLPLSPHHLSDATAVVQRMIGLDQDLERSRYRGALISRNLELFYRECHREWREKYPDRFRTVARCAALVRQQQAPEKVVADIAGQWQEWISRFPPGSSEYQELLTEVPNELIEEALKDSNGFRLLELSFAFFEPDEFPTHSQFHDWLLATMEGRAADADDLRKLTTLLHPWRADQGRYGFILDGTTNISFSQSHLHFELSEIPESAPELRSLVSFLLTNYLRNEVLKRPNSQRKRIVIEELGSFLSMEEGDRIVREFFERMRKYNCWVAAVIQQTECMSQGATSASVLGNQRMTFVLKQSNRLEIERLGKLFALPDVVQHRVAELREPTAQAGAPFLLLDQQGEGSQIIEGRNVLLGSDATQPTA